MRFAFYRCCAVGLLVLMLTGCSTAQVDSKPPASVIFQANAVLGKDALLLWVPADHTSAASLSKDLANKISVAKKQVLGICCVGPNSAKTKKVVLRALELQPEPLRGLHLLFIGDEKHKEMVKQAVKGSGGMFYFRPL